MRTELPEKWCIKNKNNCLIPYASKIPRNTWNCNADGSYYFYLGGGDFYFESKKPEGYEEITLDEFKTLVLGEKQQPTDQDLIKDGVQAIDDEFLEWFVKNPSCEEVEVEDVYKKFLNGDKRSVSDFSKKYKIIFPIEESELKCDFCKRYPRLEGTNKCESCYSVVRHSLEQDQEFKDMLLPDIRKKQETLEEAALEHCNMLDKFSALVNPLFSFKQGAKWQAEQDKNKYSEEEVRKIFDRYNEVIAHRDIEEWQPWIDKQFKKK